VSASVMALGMPNQHVNGCGAATLLCSSGMLWVAAAPVNARQQGRCTGALQKGFKAGSPAMSAAQSVRCCRR
jgi:hypothetical protein